MYLISYWIVSKLCSIFQILHSIERMSDSSWDEDNPPDGLPPPLVPQRVVAAAKTSEGGGGSLEDSDAGVVVVSDNNEVETEPASVAVTLPVQTPGSEAADRGDEANTQQDEANNNNNNASRKRKFGERKNPLPMWACATPVEGGAKCSFCDQ